MRVRGRVAASWLLAIALVGCGSSEADVQTSESLRGKRYCEVLLLEPASPGVIASVYNSFPMNDCPEAEWEKLDAVEIAKENGVPLAVLNGPRYWLMDRIDKLGGTSGPTKFFGGIEMTQRATVALANPEKSQAPYQVVEVDRKALFTFEKGSTVFELRDAMGQTFVMQSWSQQVDPTLDEAALAELGSRLELPQGFDYASRTLDAPLTVDTLDGTATVMGDELKNTYSR